MWLASMCGSNQAITKDNNIDLSKAGVVISQEIFAPMDENYHLSLGFKFETWADYEAKGPAGSVSGSHHIACEDHAQYVSLPDNEKAKLGAEIILQIEAKALNGEHYETMEFVSRCVNGWGDKAKWRKNETGQKILLKKGKYQLTIKNIHPTSVLPNGTNAFVYLTGAGAGFP